MSGAFDDASFVLIFFRKLVSGVLLGSLLGFFVAEVGTLIKVIRFLAFGVEAGGLAGSVVVSLGFVSIGVETFGVALAG